MSPGKCVASSERRARLAPLFGAEGLWYQHSEMYLYEGPWGLYWMVFGRVISRGGLVGVRVGYVLGVCVWQLGLWGRGVAVGLRRIRVSSLGG